MEECINFIDDHLNPTRSNFKLTETIWYLDVLLYTQFNLFEAIGSRNRELDFYASGEFHL